MSTPRGRQLPSDYIGKSGNEMVTPGGKSDCKAAIDNDAAANQTVVIYVEVQPTTPSSSPSRLKTDNSRHSTVAAPADHSRCRYRWSHGPNDTE